MGSLQRTRHAEPSHSDSLARRRRRLEAMLADCAWRRGPTSGAPIARSVGTGARSAIEDLLIPPSR